MVSIFTMLYTLYQAQFIFFLLSARFRHTSMSEKKHSLQNLINKSHFLDNPPVTRYPTGIYL